MARSADIHRVAGGIYLKRRRSTAIHHRKVDQDLDVLARQDGGVQLEHVFFPVPAKHLVVAAQIFEQASSHVSLVADEQDLHPYIPPPSTPTIAPAMNEACSEHRNAVTPATSAAVPRRRVGKWLSKYCSRAAGFSMVSLAKKRPSE